MSVYIENHLTISGLRKDLEAFRENAVGIDPTFNIEEYNRFCFQRLVPVPRRIRKSDNGDERGKWVEKNWGGAWGAEDTSCSFFCDESGVGLLVYEFLTRNGAPDKLLEKVSAKYPRLLFTWILVCEDDAGLIFARKGNLAKSALNYSCEPGNPLNNVFAFYDNIPEMFHADDESGDGPSSIWRFIPELDMLPSVDSGPVPAPATSSRSVDYCYLPLADHSWMSSCDDKPAWNYRLKIVGPGSHVDKFRRDVCFDDPDNGSIVSLALGKRFWLSRYRDQKDAIRFLRCDKIGKASLELVKPDAAGTASLKLCFTAVWMPLLHFIRVVSTLYPLLMFKLTSFRGGLGLAETGTFVAGKLCDFKHGDEETGDAK